MEKTEAGLRGLCIREIDIKSGSVKQVRLCIGPSLYLVYSMDLKTVSSFNKLIKYADDTSLLVPQ